MDDINWWNKAVDWGWIIISGAVVALGGGYMKLWRQHDRHHERLRALEGQHQERVQQLDGLSKNMEYNRRELTNKLDDLRTELRGDLRAIQEALIRR